MTTCRRCTECRHRDHHWIESSLAPDDPDFEPGEYVCKHCGERGIECETCHGDGFVLFGDTEVFCPTCGDTSGVRTLTDEEYHHEMYRSLEKD